MKKVINLVLIFLVVFMVSGIINISDKVYKARFINQYDMNLNMSQNDSVIINDDYVITIKHNN